MKNKVRLLICLLTVVLTAIQCQKTPVSSSTNSPTKNYPASLSKKEVALLGPIEKSESLTLTSLDNQIYKVGKGGDKKTILVLYATWCGTCKLAMPAIDSAFSKKENVNVLAVGRFHGVQELKEWRTKTRYSLPVIADSTGAVFSKFATQYVPRIYVIDTSGNVLHQDFGWGEYMIKDINEVVSGR